MEQLLPPPHTATHSRRASPAGKPPPPPRVTRASASLSMSMALQNKTTTTTTTAELLGQQLVAALDDTSSPPSNFGAAFSSMRRVRSDSTLSTDTFDGIYSLGDGVEMDDVDDLVADDELGEVDVDVDDVFRPGALLDRQLEDEFDATRTSDLERMLLASGAAGEDDEEDTAAVIAHLARLDSMQLAQELAAKKKPQQGGFCALVPRADATLVVAAAAVVDTMDVDSSSQHLEIAAALPPKYVAEQRRRVHKRTFGERTTSFNFRFPNAPEAAAMQPCKVGTKRGRSLFQEATEDIAMRDVDRDDKENFAPAPIQASAAMDKEDEKMKGSREEHASHENKTEPVQEKPQPQQLQPQTPVRSLVTAVADVFKTPLRRSVTAPGPSSSTQSAFQTPIATAKSEVSKTPTAGVTVVSTMSPAPSFDKVAVVHAKGTPGRVDKFEWTIRAKTALFSAQQSTPAIPLPEPLPPRYLGDASGSPQKRRIHSTTFGAFARSFSFK